MFKYLYFTFVFTFQDPASIYAFAMISFHHTIMWYLIVILCLVIEVFLMLF